MTPTFNATEQTLIDDAVRTGGTIAKQPWLPAPPAPGDADRG